MRTILIAVVMIASLMATSTVTAAGAASSDVDVVILGGSTVVSSGVLNHLASCTDGTVTRIAGSDRYATAAAVSRAAFASASVVYLTVGSSFPEAVAAGPIAALRNAPLLLTRRDSLPAETRAEIRRLGATEVIVLGGTGAVSSSVEADLARSHRVTRISGTDRYSTVAAISASYFQPGRVRVAYIARGDLFADSLAGGPAAVASGGPILLTRQSSLPSATAAELRRLAPAKIVILGGSAAVSVGVENALGAYTAGSVSRLGGSNRYDTAARISTTLTAGPQTVYLATADNFPDALAGVPLTGGAPLLLVTQQTVPVETANRIAAITGISCAPLGPLASLGTPPPGTNSGPSGVLWFADHESGGVSQWDGVSISGDADAEVVSSPARSGGDALKLIKWHVDGSHSAGVRMRVEELGPDPENLPTDAYYSVWYFVPFAFEGMSNVFQFKQADVDRWDAGGNPTHQTRRMLSSFTMNWDGAGYDLEYKTRIDQGTGAWRGGPADSLLKANTNIPVGEWFHVEMRYVWNDQGRGRSTLWLNGSQVWDLTGLYTEANNLVYNQEPRQWVVSHYLGDWQGYVAPGDSWIMIDDAVISTNRTGP
jgi:putative cell wall-binding protein